MADFKFTSRQISAGAIKTEVEFRGVNRVRNQLRALASAVPDVTDPVVEKHAKTMAAFLRRKQYPPRRPNQKYKRTGELGRRFRAQRRGRESWAVINRAKRKGQYYAVWVIKKGMQNRQFHLGRWWTLEDEMQKSMPRLTRNLTVALDQLIERQPD